MVSEGDSTVVSVYNPKQHCGITLSGWQRQAAGTSTAIAATSAAAMAFNIAVIVHDSR